MVEIKQNLHYKIKNKSYIVLTQIIKMKQSHTLHCQTRNKIIV